jgi:hypothetical protein
MHIQYIGHKDHSVMFDEEYIFKGSGFNIQNQYILYNVPDSMGAFLCKNYPENVDSANSKGIIFREVKKK